MNNWFLDQARKGNVFHSNTTTSKAVTAIHATHTGLSLTNPFGSGKDVIMESMSFASSTLTTIAEVGIGVAPAVAHTLSGTTTATVIHNAKLSGGGFSDSIVEAYDTATLTSTPVWLMPMAGLRITAAVEGAETITKHIDGTIIVPPGFFICIMTLATARTGLCSATWAELDVLTEEQKAAL